MWLAATRRLIELACEEDLGAAGDITSALLPGGTTPTAARVVPRKAGVICGLALGAEICTVFAQRLGQRLEFTASAAPSGRNWQDGDAIAAGECVATVAGPRAAVLAAERTVLNFLSRLSGVATLTRRYVEAAHAANPHVQVLDTRKTLPGWRQLDKYAVRCGGGHNHRTGLYDAVLIKDNHLAGIPLDRLAATLTEWLEQLKAPASFVEVEVDSLEQLAEVCKVAAVNVVLLDNFTPAQMRTAVAQRDAAGLRGKLALEASGGVTLETIADVAATGVERISVGALTHSAAGLDIGLDV
jgi:nicotinate-nucleotide pyrophosphorylase (carboxylating)